MTQSEIECFLAVCRHKTMTQAAESLFITQPSLSARLKTLERELGGPLFERGKGSRTMTLTAAGKRFELLAVQYESVVRQMKAVCQKPRDRLRISAINSVSTYFLPLVCDRFLSEWPEYHLEVQDMGLDTAVGGLLDGSIDLIFTSGTVTDERLVRTPVFSEAMVLIGGEGVFPAGPVAFAQLGDSREIYIEWSHRFAAWHRQNVKSAPPRITISIMTQLKQFMQAGDCWAIVPRSIAAGLAAEGCPIRIYDAAFPLPGREISVVAAAAGADGGIAEDFLQCVKRAVAEYTNVQPLI